MVRTFCTLGRTTEIYLYYYEIVFGVDFGAFSFTQKHTNIKIITTHQTNTTLSLTRGHIVNNVLFPIVFPFMLCASCSMLGASLCFHCRDNPHRTKLTKVAVRQWHR